MPSEGALLVGVYLLGFVLFGTVMAWGDYYTNSRPRDGRPAE